jgi:hypothetical protein
VAYFSYWPFVDELARAFVHLGNFFCREVLVLARGYTASNFRSQDSDYIGIFLLQNVK